VELLPGCVGKNQTVSESVGRSRRVATVQSRVGDPHAILIWIDAIDEGDPRQSTAPCARS